MKMMKIVTDKWFIQYKVIEHPEKTEEQKNYEIEVQKMNFVGC